MKRVFLSALTLIVGYVGLIEFWDPPFRVAEEQEGRNIVRAEQLRLRGEMPHTVVVGSSLIDGMQAFVDENSLFFLPQGGGSAREGLSFLVDQGLLPKRVIVETNALTVRYRDDFIGKFHGPIRGFLPMYLKAFRYQNRPMNVFLSALYAFYRPDGEQPERQEAPRGGEVLRIRAAGLLELYQAPPDAVRYHANLEATVRLLEHLRAGGVEIILIELPIYPEFSETVYHTVRRKELFAALEDAGSWHDWSTLEDARFTDAIHFAGTTLARIAKNMQRLASN